MTTTAAWLKANSDYASRYEGGQLVTRPRQHIAILTCMDSRIEPQRLLGLKLGDAHIIRNAGGRATDDALRSLVISSHILETREFLVIHHTECGLMGVTNADIRERVTAQTETHIDVTGIDFLPFPDLDHSVRVDVEKIRQSPLMPKDITVRGFVFDVRTGLLTLVED